MTNSGCPTSRCLCEKWDLLVNVETPPSAVRRSANSEICNLQSEICNQKSPNHQFTGVCSNGSFVYRTFSTSIIKATRPSGLRNGNGLPVYLCEIASIILKSESGRRSTT